MEDIISNNAFAGLPCEKIDIVRCYPFKAGQGGRSQASAKISEISLRLLGAMSGAVSRRPLLGLVRGKTDLRSAPRMAACDPIPVIQPALIAPNFGHSFSYQGVKARTTAQKLFENLTALRSSAPYPQFLVDQVAYVSETDIRQLMGKLTFAAIAMGGQADQFADLLCLKRTAFEYKAEVRLLFQDIDPRRGLGGVFQYRSSQISSSRMSCSTLVCTMLRRPY